MTVQELIKELSSFPDYIEVCIGLEFRASPINELCLANVDLDEGDIWSEEGEEDFDEQNPVLLLKGK